MAAASEVRAGRAYVELGVDSKALAKGLNAAATKLKAFGSAITGIGKSLMAAGTAVTGPLTLMAKGFADSGSRILEMSKRTGVSVEALSQLSYAAQRSGIDVEVLEGGLRKMQRTIFAAASGSASAQEALSLLGLNLRKLSNLSPDQQFKAIADALAAVPDPTIKAAMAMQIFGKTGTALLPMMENGAAGIEAFEKKAQELGLTTTTQSAKAAKALSLAFGDFASVTKKTSSILGSALANTLRQTTQYLTDLVVKLNAFIKSHQDMVVAVFKFAKIVFAVGVGLVVLGTVISKIGTGFGILATLVTQVAAVLGTIGAVLAWLVSPIGLVIAALAALGAYLIYSTGAGTKALAWLSGRFVSLKDDAIAAWGGIADALAAGDIALAARILWLSLKMAWQNGVASLQQTWLAFASFFVKVAYGAFYGTLAATQYVWHAMKVVWIEGVAFLQKTWATFISWHAKAVEGLADSFTKAWIWMQEKTDKTFDAAAARQYAEQQHQMQSRQIERDRDSDLGQAERDRQAHRAAESQSHEARLAELGQAYNDMAAGAEADRADKARQTQAQLEQARKEWQDAIAAAKAKRQAKEAADSGPGQLEAPGKLNGKLADLGKLLDQAQQRTIGVRGTFSAIEAQRLGAGSVTDRIAHASESTAANTRKILEEMRENGAEFE